MGDKTLQKTECEKLNIVKDASTEKKENESARKRENVRSGIPNTRE
jgi:hypothetical protein